MSKPAPIEFWFCIGSTYAYMSIMRANGLAAERGVSIEWRPFNARKIMREMDNRFLTGKPEKYAYMWQDIGRRAAQLGLPSNVPVPHPLKEFDMSNQVAIVAQRGGWLVEYAQATYIRWYRDRTEPGSDPNLRETLLELGRDPAQVLAEARTDEVIAALDAVTAEARGKGIFGAPTFVVGSEHFWGDDKLEDAISWALNGRLPIVTWV